MKIQKLRIIPFLLAGVILGYCLHYLKCQSEIKLAATAETNALVDPVIEYSLAVLLKKKLDSISGSYSDSMIETKIRELGKGKIPKGLFSVTRVDTGSYEIVVRPDNFNVTRGDYWLITQDSIYVLQPR